MKERRINPRVSTNLPITIQLSNGETVKAKLVNISISGLGISYKASADVGTVLGLRFTLPINTRPVEFNLQGTVIHTHLKDNHYYIGFEFMHLSHEVIEQLDTFIRKIDMLQVHRAS